MSQNLHRRDFLKTAASTALVAAGASAAPPLAGGKHPNLVFVFPDEMRGQAVGILNEDPVITPNLDAMAREGLILPEAVSTYPVCSPYRAMFMTGRYPHSNRVLSNCTNRWADNNCELQEADRCWSDVLSDQGYSLGYIGKWHLDAPRKPYIDCANNRGKTKWNEWCPPNRRHGFDFWYSYGTYDHHLKPMYWSTKATRDGFKYVEQWGPEHEADTAIKYIRNEGGAYRKPDRPFALVVSMNPPHMPYHLVPDRYKELYKDTPVEQLCNRPNVPAADTRWGKHYRRHVKNYFSGVTGVDDQFGRIVKAIDDAGLGEDTIIVFTSDHGDCLGIHEKQTKNNRFEESMRIPFLVRWKGKIKPRRDDLLLSTPDIYPTLLDLMGFGEAIPKQVEGVSLAAVFLTGKGERPASQLYMRANPQQPQYGPRGVRTHDWKLVVTKRKDRPTQTYLYDRKSDPYEMASVADTRPEKVKELTAELERWLKKTNDPWLEQARP